MIAFDTLFLFLATTFVVVMSPGPAAIAVTAQAASSGYSKAFWIILGIASANVVFFILSATGIAALIIASNVLFAIIKWVGVAYLLYLGLSAIFAKTGPLTIKPNDTSTVKTKQVFLKGFILELANPKALLYFSALLPQFIDTTRALLPQLATLGIITLLLDLLCYSFYAYLGAKTTQTGIKPWLIKTINRSAGGMLIFAGVKMASVKP